MISIVIPVFNRWHFTYECLSSLEKQTCKSFKVVVVDHGSTDGTSYNIAKFFPNVIVLKGSSKMWWSAATNLGIRYSLDNLSIDFILTLNNDTVAEENYVSKLVEAAEYSYGNSIIGSTAIHIESKKVIYRGERLNWFSETSLKLKDVVLERPKCGLISVSHFPGRGMLIPVQVIREVGYFDDYSFPHYMADYEFTLRASKKGFNVYCAWDAIIATYPNESGANKLKVSKSLESYKEHLFGTKGGGNLLLFYKYALRHCPVYSIPSHLLLGTVRRLVGYWL